MYVARPIDGNQVTCRRSGGTKYVVLVPTWLLARGLRFEGFVYLVF